MNTKLILHTVFLLGLALIWGATSYAMRFSVIIEGSKTPDPGFIYQVYLEDKLFPFTPFSILTEEEENYVGVASKEFKINNIILNQRISLDENLEPPKTLYQVSVYSVLNNRWIMRTICDGIIPKAAEAIRLVISTGQDGRSSNCTILAKYYDAF